MQDTVLCPGVDPCTDQTAWITGCDSHCRNTQQCPMRNTRKHQLRKPPERYIVTGTVLNFFSFFSSFFLMRLYRALTYAVATSLFYVARAPKYLLW